MMPMMDNFSGYNQVLVAEKDQDKNAFTTAWGTFQYLRMPFRLFNAGSAFQRAMDYAFQDIMGKIIVVYQDDLTVFSKDRTARLSSQASV